MNVILVLLVTLSCIVSVSNVSASKAIATRVVQTDCVVDCLTLHPLKDPPAAGVCQVAAELEVAVGTCPTLGVPVIVIPPTFVLSPAVRPVAVPVTFVITPDAGVPSAGVVRTGDVRVLFVRVSVVARPTSVSLESCKVYVLSAVFVLVKSALNVFATLRSANIPARKVFTPVANVLVLVSVGTVAHSTAITHAETRDIVVSVACHSSTDQTQIAVDVLAVIPATGNPVQFVRVQDDGVPRTGVVRVGLVRVLFVRVSVEFLDTNVSVAPVGNVNTPPDTVMAAILGVVNAGDQLRTIVDQVQVVVFQSAVTVQVVAGNVRTVAVPATAVG